MLTNNDILKKLRVALALKNDDIIEILALENFKISKGAFGAANLRTCSALIQP